MTAELLTHDDRISPAWGKVRKHLESELDRLRRYNDRRHDIEETAWTRGQIEQIKAVLALGQEPKLALVEVKA